MGAMVFARNEIEYLSSQDRRSETDLAFVSDMWHRLDALRCFDQNINQADWQPHSSVPDVFQIEGLRRASAENK
jgi:hypothetical protein